MSLSVIVKSASNLPNVEKFSKSDPFTVVTFRGEYRAQLLDAMINILLANST